MPVLAVSKVRKPEQRETRLKSQIETRPWAPSCCAIPSSLPRAGLVHRPAKAFSVSRVVSLVVGETRDEETLFGLT